MHTRRLPLCVALGEWKPVPFDCAEYRDSGTYILRGLDEIQSLFDDHIVKTQARRFPGYHSSLVLTLSLVLTPSWSSPHPGTYPFFTAHSQAMRSSPFVKPFELRMKEWETKLMSMQETSQKPS